MRYKKFNRQRVFNAVVKHLFEQGGPALKKDEEGCYVCRYRTNDNGTGKACGIGGVIADKDWSLDLEGKGVSTPEVMSAMGYRVIPSQDDRFFLSSVQANLHDQIATTKGGFRRVPPKEYMKRLPDAVRTLAKRFNLKVPAIVPAE